MKFIRLTLISIAAFFSLSCIVSFFIPSHIRIFRMVHIAPHRDSVLNNIRDLSKWKNWCPGFETITLKETQTHNQKTVKAKSNGITITITESSDSAIVAHMQRNHRSVISTWQINKSLQNDSLVLQAYMDFKLKWYPWEKFSSLMLDKSYGDILSAGLRACLKIKCENDYQGNYRQKSISKDVNTVPNAILLLLTVVKFAQNRSKFTL